MYIVEMKDRYDKTTLKILKETFDLDNEKNQDDLEEELRIVRSICHP